MRVFHVFHVCLALVLLGMATVVNAASFDCKLARSQVEHLICADSGLSQLDDRLQVAYAELRNSTADEKAEKAMQLAWLHIRNTCADAACLRRAYENRIAELQARAASRSAMVGIWKKEYDCSQVTGIYEERCKQGERDVFELAITIVGDKVCILHMATAQLGNRVDEVEDLEPSMTGKLDAKVAQVKFRSHWGGTGKAMLRVEGNTLRWRVTGKDGGESWIPDEAVLSRVAAGPADRLPACQP